MPSLFVRLSRPSLNAKGLPPPSFDTATFCVGVLAVEMRIRATHGSCLFRLNVQLLSGVLYHGVKLFSCAGNNIVMLPLLTCNLSFGLVHLPLLLCFLLSAFRYSRRGLIFGHQSTIHPWMILQWTLDVESRASLQLSD